MVKDGDGGLYAVTDLGTGKPGNKEEEWLSQIITRLNDLVVTDGLTDRDLINYAYTIRDKVRENERVMHQIANNSAEQALLCQCLLCVCAFLKAYLRRFFIERSKSEIPGAPEADNSLL